MHRLRGIFARRQAVLLGILAWAAQQTVEGTGALGPLQAYGLAALEAGCREAGLERVVDP